MPSFPQKKQPLSPGAEPVCARSAGLVPQPVFSLTSPVHGGPSAVSVLRLPRLIAEVGPRKALQGSKWTQGPQLVASALGTELPVTVASTQHGPLESEQAEQPREISQSQRSAASCRKYPATVSEVLHMLITGGAQQRPLVFYLREEQGPERRPYDLRVVPPSEADRTTSVWFLPLRPVRSTYVYVCVLFLLRPYDLRVVPPSEADCMTSVWFVPLRPVRSTMFMLSLLRPYDLRVVPPSKADRTTSVWFLPLRPVQSTMFMFMLSLYRPYDLRLVPPSEADLTTSVWFLPLRPVRSTYVYVYVVSSQTVRPPCDRTTSVWSLPLRPVQSTMFMFMLSLLSPYDLRVVTPSEAGPEHYIFCRGGVVHVTLSGYGGVVSLAQWYREAVYWDALHNISFFRTFRLRKAFYWWRAVVRRSVFLQRCEKLQKLLLTDCSLYRRAVLALLRALEEVRASHWLPQSGSYKLVEFIKTEQNQKKEFERSLEVQREKHRSLQQLQHHVRLSQQAQYFSGPMYLHQRHQQELKKELHTAEHHLSRFMALVQLLNYMCVETVVSVVQQDVTRFTHNLLQAQCLVFQTEMIIDPEGRLSVEPGLQQVLCVLSELLSHKDYVLQKMEEVRYSLLEWQVEAEVEVEEEAEQRLKSNYFNDFGLDLDLSLFDLELDTYIKPCSCLDPVLVWPSGGRGEAQIAPAALHVITCRLSSRPSTWAMYCTTETPAGAKEGAHTADTPPEGSWLSVQLLNYMCVGDCGSVWSAGMFHRFTHNLLEVT
ncbi:hypothetical protein WMY93_005588 [Mugilogobius chulae]|uniref:Dynein heavy chain domain-containing protein 1 n=1 Tax=Mugilogobius chulae TaxID=88201 RepID=A0AAW0PWL4_9GOBI